MSAATIETKVDDRKIDTKTEVIAGLTTFLTMSYIIVVNPSILSTEGTGMSFSGVMTGTILISFFATLLMGLYAKLPFALAPGMGLNAFFTYSLILGQGIPWTEALGMVFWSGVIFVIVSVTPLREKIVEAIPQNLRWALACGIGVFLTFIGLKNATLIEAHPVTFVHHAKLSLPAGLSMLGLLIMIYFTRKKNPAVFVIGIGVVTLAALLTGLIQWPEQIFMTPDFKSVFFAADIWGGLRWAYWPSILTLMMTDLFDSISTFIGVSETSGLIDKDGRPKNVRRALLVDALGTLFSGLFGTSAATAYIESSAGTSVGGRTGLTAIVAAFCFLPFLFLSPLISTIPPYATAPVLILIGVMMFKNVGRINFSKIEEAVPAFLIMLLISFTFSITQGIIWGFLLHNLLFIAFGRAKELHPIMLVIGAVSAVLIFFQ